MHLISLHLMKTLLSIIILSLFHSAVSASSYAIVVRDAVYADADWQKVCSALQKKHTGAVVLKWKDDLEETLPELKKLHPAHTCFVAPCDQVGPKVVAEIHRLTRQYDDDIYTDTRWGILTGYDANAALATAEFNQPIVVKKVSSGTEIAMEMVEEGIAYDELVKNKVVKKMDGAKEPVQSEGPTDTTQLLAETLTDWKSDLFITSGHGYEQGWQIGFSYKNGYFRSSDGKLMGEKIGGEKFPFSSDHPRVYLPIGNCLVGCIKNKNAYALAMMKSGGVKGMIGYTVPTWYGYAGWGMLDYYVEQPGRYTLNEAFLANQHALVHRLETSFPGSMKHHPDPGKTVRPAKDLVVKSPAGPGLTDNVRDFPGLLHDRDVLAYYGDPALSARMSPRVCAYDQKLIQEGGVYTFTVTGNRGEKSFAPVNRNGSQRGGRPILQFLPARVAEVEIIEGKELHPVITDDFILIPNPGKGDRLTVKFRVISSK